MSGLVMLDGERFRDATPWEVFQSAESLAPSRSVIFPHSFTVRTQQDAESIVRWFAAPLATPQLLCVLLDEACEVMQYQQVPLAGSEDILEKLLGFSKAPYGASHVWVFFVEPPQARPAASDPLGDWLMSEFRKKGCDSYHYLRIMADQALPVVTSLQEIETPLWVADPTGYRPALPQEVLGAAEMLCARRLKRGQVLRGTIDALEALQLCVTPLTQPSFGIALLDTKGRFLDYRSICDFDDYFCGDTDTVLRDWRAMAEQARAMLATGGILVRAKTESRLALNRSEDKMIRILFKLLQGIELATYACAVVGTSGLEIYNTYRLVTVQPGSSTLH